MHQQNSHYLQCHILQKNQAIMMWLLLSHLYFMSKNIDSIHLSIYHHLKTKDHKYLKQSTYSHKKNLQIIPCDNFYFLFYWIHFSITLAKLNQHKNTNQKSLITSFSLYCRQKNHNPHHNDQHILQFCILNSIRV